jgi:hypothetical protein
VEASVTRFDAIAKEAAERLRRAADDFERIVEVAEDQVRRALDEWQASLDDEPKRERT